MLKSSGATNTNPDNTVANKLVSNFNSLLQEMAEVLQMIMNAPAYGENVVAQSDDITPMTFDLNKELAHFKVHHQKDKERIK